VTSFVDGSAHPFLIAYSEALSFDAHHDSVSRKLKVILVSFLLASMNSLRDCSVHKILNLSSREPRRHQSPVVGLNIVFVGNLVKVELKDVLSTIDVRMGNVDLLVKSARSSGCSVEAVFVVGGADDHDVLVLLEAIHLSQELVDGGSRTTALTTRAPRLGE